ncbi:hypothetical protein ACFFX0_19590 [Citricoccus parietis]|uniref:Uncharacterized protein n=1 Tax=Citricoccus parietis TaxID=592307 RepID=A0ABV5G2X1_9MICC
MGPPDGPPAGGGATMQPATVAAIATAIITTAVGAVTDVVRRFRRRGPFMPPLWAAPKPPDAARSCPTPSRFRIGRLDTVPSAGASFAPSRGGRLPWSVHIPL